MDVLLKRVFVHKTQNSLVQFFRYGFVSVASLAVDFSILVLLTEVFHLHYIVAASISFLLGLTTSYLLSTRWVFHSSKLISRNNEVLLFAGIGLIGLVMTDLIMWLLTEEIGLFYIVSKIVATVIVYFWNFGARKKYLFN